MNAQMTWPKGKGAIRRGRLSSDPKRLGAHKGRGAHGSCALAARTRLSFHACTHHVGLIAWRARHRYSKPVMEADVLLNTPHGSVPTTSMILRSGGMFRATLTRSV
jgi:hypothetical protein